MSCTVSIKLSGPLARKFGRTHERHLDSGQSWEVFKALNATLAGFEAEIRRLDRLGMRFAIFRNRANVNDDAFALGGTRELRIVPVLAGSKRAGILQTVIGAVLIVAGTYFGQAWAVQLGAGLAVGGVIQMLSPQASGLRQSASPENLPSYAFGSAKNTTASGNPVPICIGERRWGGAIISASIYAEDKT
ncbi:MULTISPECIES: tail assembly protein [unclassified Pseudomonas]|uniref:tail assembly protein n=1 Tax=unclassified Pseudomonas TaxID=196821 RepID=UPI000BC7EA6C|nr:MULTISPECIES: tail assembly protein [unclassified Pseudomonas]PVZ19916.1 putative phage tail protein [Pseudomonas sp. URIL14HWK12:I12]PVZ26982.1 putative phage tail protein [Pseudomonas sp. URIL14HWK12:I10]PVZ37871.1 putative phage tail protein [Pseudomonas sp. URIL14HWK12:I11]SNZ05333.1 Phage-related protein, tail component [Pseudomonas sp. URIL14HWK12:I9]